MAYGGRVMSDEKKKLRIVIVGGVAGGASAAARARRHSEKAEIVLIERGSDVSFANCGLPYHISGEIPNRAALALQTPNSLRATLNLDVRIRTEAISIDRKKKTVVLRKVDTGETETLSYDKLILAPGAHPIRPPLPGIDDPNVLTLRNLDDMDRIIQSAQSVDSATVVGAGFIGLEMAEQLAKIGKSITVVEMQPQVLPQLDAEMARPLQDHSHRARGTLHHGQARERTRHPSRHGDPLHRRAPGKRAGEGSRSGTRRTRPHRGGCPPAHFGPRHLCSGRCVRKH